MKFGRRLFGTGDTWKKLPFPPLPTPSLPILLNRCRPTCSWALYLNFINMLCTVHYQSACTTSDESWCTFSIRITGEESYRSAHIILLKKFHTNWELQISSESSLFLHCIFYTFLVIYALIFKEWKKYNSQKSETSKTFNIHSSY